MITSHTLYRCCAQYILYIDGIRGCTILLDYTRSFIDLINPLSKSSIYLIETFNLFDVDYILIYTLKKKKEKFA